MILARAPRRDSAPALFDTQLASGAFSLRRAERPGTRWRSKTRAEGSRVLINTTLLDHTRPCTGHRTYAKASAVSEKIFPAGSIVEPWPPRSGSGSQRATSSATARASSASSSRTVSSMTSRTPYGSSWPAPSTPPRPGSARSTSPPRWRPPAGRRSPRRRPPSPRRSATYPP